MIAIFLLGFAVAATEPLPQAAAAPVAQTTLDSAARPRAPANLASYLSDTDYPIEAIRNGEQGTVRFRLHITPGGRVGGCHILESSGSATLDSTTCAIMTERPRFTPAKDSNGEAVADELESRIRWVLPADDPIDPLPSVRAVSLVDLEHLVGPADYPPEARGRGEHGMVQISLLIAPDGTIEECVVGRSSASAALDAASCALVQKRARFTPARDAQGKPAYDAITTWIDWTLPAAR